MLIKRLKFSFGIENACLSIQVEIIWDIEAWQRLREKKRSELENKKFYEYICVDTYSYFRIQKLVDLLSLINDTKTIKTPKYIVYLLNFDLLKLIGTVICWLF